MSWQAKELVDPVFNEASRRRVEILFTQYSNALSREVFAIYESEVIRKNYKYFPFRLLSNLMDVNEHHLGSSKNPIFIFMKTVMEDMEKPVSRIQMSMKINEWTNLFKALITLNSSYSKKTRTSVFSEPVKMEPVFEKHVPAQKKQVAEIDNLRFGRLSIHNNQ